MVSRQRKRNLSFCRLCAKITSWKPRFFLCETLAMLHFVEAVRRSLREQNWYAALSGTLSLPDIASRLDGRTGGRSRYISWFDEYVTPKYTRTIPDIEALNARKAAGQPIMPLPQKSQVFLSGRNCYAVRCAYLHEGEFDITSQEVRDVLVRFHFITPPKNNTLHCNLLNQSLQLQVDIFCEDVCAAVETWLQNRGTDPAVQSALLALPVIIDSNQPGGFKIK